MGSPGVRTAVDPLRAVRIHPPGLELWASRIDDPEGAHEGPAGPDRIRREHATLVEALETAGVTVHRLADDLADGDRLAGVLEEHVRGMGAATVRGILDGLGPRERLGLALARARLDRTEKGATTIHVDRPLSMAYRLRDATIVGDRGPILAAMSERGREAEPSIARAAWEATGGDVVHRADPELGPIEGADFLPAGEFALLGVSGVVEGRAVVHRTAIDAARALLDADALGFSEVVLVRSPIEAAETRFSGHPRATPGPLTAWCNLAAEDLAVLDTHLACNADVEVYVRSDDGYEHDRSDSLLEYLQGRGYDWVNVGAAERWPTGFLPIDDGVVVPTYEPANDGTYHAELNPTIEALKGRGVTVLPDDEGVPGGALADTGGVHAMTCPIERN